MRPHPPVRMTSRAKRDLADCLDFIARNPWGDTAAREQDIYFEMANIRRSPEHRRVEAHRSTGIELRGRSAAQFVIVYAYFKPGVRRPRGRISIRAIRHCRVRNVFAGVREPTPPADGWSRLLSRT